MTVKTITLTAYRRPDPARAAGNLLTEYQIDAVKDSTKYTPGDYLPKAELDALCESSAWCVTINRPRD